MLNKLPLHVRLMLKRMGMVALAGCGAVLLVYLGVQVEKLPPEYNVLGLTAIIQGLIKLVKEYLKRELEIAD